MFKKYAMILLTGLLSMHSFTAQQVVLSGKVTDSLQQPLAFANVVAKPQSSAKLVQFSITDDQGRYSLKLDSDELYKISISYMGFRTNTFEIQINTNSERVVVLQESANQLETVTIELPVSVKEDTITYTTSKFVTGEERKLKNVLKKLPGVAVDKDGTVTLMGRKITNMLVEGKKFFGGGTKLAIDNIPANAVHKVQVIDNYSEIALLKGLTDTNDIAMNIQLKEDKKRFVFGDIAAGKGNRDFYRGHGSIFYYSPKTNLNIIGNSNNTNEKTLTFKDYMNFQGGVSAVLRNGSSLFNIETSDFSQFLVTEELLKSSNEMVALNYSGTTKNKLNVAAYGIFSNSTSTTLYEHLNDYQEFIEQSTQSNKNKSLFGIGKIVVENDDQSHSKWISRSQFKKISQNKNRDLISQISDENRAINVATNRQEFNFNQNFEWHKKWSKQHTLSVALDAVLGSAIPETYWTVNKPILQGILPLNDEEQLVIKQDKKTINQQINAVLKHYWVLNPKHHFYTTLGTQFKKSTFSTADSQLLAEGSTIDFSTSGFNNNLQLFWNDSFLQTHYKFRIGKAILKQGISMHYFNWKLNQAESLKKSTFVILPDFLAKVDFSRARKLTLNYQLKTDFAAVDRLANRLYLKNYNAVYKGNEMLGITLLHSAYAYYSQFSMFRGVMFATSVSYSKKIRGQQQNVQFVNTDQFITTTTIRNPEERWHMMLNYNKKVKQFKFGLKTTLSISKFLQTINAKQITNTNSVIGTDVSVKTLYDKFPVLEVGFKATNGTYNSNGMLSKFVTREPYISIHYDFWNGFLFAIDYYKQQYENKSQSLKNSLSIANATMSFKSENSPWGFSLKANNLFDVKYKRQYQFRSYVVSDNKTYIFPRMLLFSIAYHL